MRPKNISEQLSDEHLKAVGMISAEWEHLSMSLRTLVGRLSGMGDPAQTIVLRKLTTIPLLECAEALVQWHPKDLSSRFTQEFQDKVTAICKRFDAARTERNDYIHAVWMLFGEERDQHYVHKVSKGKKFKAEIVPREVEPMKELAAKIAELGRDVRELSMQLDQGLR